MNPIKKIQGKLGFFRNDSYSNMLAKAGASKVNTGPVSFAVPDNALTTLYESNGLFSKIIDTPAEEALKKGFSLGVNDQDFEGYCENALDNLDWEEKAATAIKWSRLYGGALIVMMINDGGDLDDPVNLEKVKGIDELLVFERAVVTPDYSSLYANFGDGKHSKFGKVEYYTVSSYLGTFTVHESRCLVFRNGVLPESTTNTNYRCFGIPEYVRVGNAVKEALKTHTNAYRLLERSVQAVYSMKNLSDLLATDEGEDAALGRLELIDMARSFLNTIAIDADGESYEFKTFTFTGIKDVLESTCTMLSSLTNIPQSILFGRSPAGLNSTGESDLESYYTFVERIQKVMLKRNLEYLLDIIFKSGVNNKELKEILNYKVKFDSLWSLSDLEVAETEQKKAQAALIKAQTAQIYVDMSAMDPSEVRMKLASSDEFIVEDIVDENYVEGELFDSVFGNEDKRADGWVTINGTHVMVDENTGLITKGPSDFIGKTPSELENSSKNGIITNNQGNKKKKTFPAHHKSIKLPRDEYAHVMSEIASHLTEIQKTKRYFEKYIGDSIYTVKNDGFGDYKIISKRRLK